MLSENLLKNILLLLQYPQFALLKYQGATRNFICIDQKRGTICIFSGTDNHLALSLALSSETYTIVVGRALEFQIHIENFLV